MIVAESKRKTNIAEYILYMWQVEDLIRAHSFNIDLIEKNLISQYQQSKRVKNEIRDWYANLILMMHEEGIRQQGHLSFLKTLMDELNQCHLKLLKDSHEQKYHQLYFNASENIVDFKSRLNNPHISEVEACMNALYGLLLLRLKKEPVSTETQQAMSTFSKMIALLSEKFLEAERAAAGKK